MKTLFDGFKQAADPSNCDSHSSALCSTAPNSPQHRPVESDRRQPSMSRWLPFLEEGGKGGENAVQAGRAKAAP